MKRRNFGFLAASSLATAAYPRMAQAQSAPDPSLLRTTLTPLGGERAGNADGSIPTWTGGMVSAPLPVSTPADLPLFSSEHPLYTVNAANIAKYQHLLAPCTQAQIQQFGMSIQVYQSHRTAAAPQYVYDNTAKNVLSAQFEAGGGRLGFTGAYGGTPFPIINTSDSLTSGAQLIWNHLTAWNGLALTASFTPGIVVIDGRPELVQGDMDRTVFPYYDPNGSADTFAGYFSKIHTYAKAPASVEGEENLIWHSTNVNRHPDIVWTLVNGQSRVRKAPDEAYGTPDSGSNGISNLDETSGFYGNPSQYDWRFIGKQDMLVPYNNNALALNTMEQVMRPHFLNPDILRWEKHRVWIVEATLRPDARNVNQRRRFYIDEDTWVIMLGEGYDGDGNMWKAYANYVYCLPSLPGTVTLGGAVYNILTGDYAFDGYLSIPPNMSYAYAGPLSDSFFTPEQMAANSSF